MCSSSRHIINKKPQQFASLEKYKAPKTFVHIWQLSKPLQDISQHRQILMFACLISALKLRFDFTILHEALIFNDVFGFREKYTNSKFYLLTTVFFE